MTLKSKDITCSKDVNNDNGICTLDGMKLKEGDMLKLPFLAIFRSVMNMLLTSASVMMFPEADHVNTSIWPGVSITTYLQGQRSIR